MAILTVSKRLRNCIGNKWQDMGTVTTDGSGEGVVHTTLHWIEHITIISKAGNEVNGVISTNSDTKTIVEDTTDAGHFFMSDYDNSSVYEFIAEGK